MAGKSVPLILAGAGSIIVYSGLKGWKWSQTLRNVITGQPPETSQIDPATGKLYNAITGANLAAYYGSSTDNSGDLMATVNPAYPGSQGNTAAYKAFAKTLMVSHKWGLGQQWTDFQWVVAHESGWDNHATNSSSGAYGIAQALGHGTGNTHGTVTNMYGNYGTSDAICKAANSGNGFAQLIWMCNYIAQVYGTPSHVRAVYNQGY